MTYHVPVLVKETVTALQVKPGGRYIDCTVGEGGHAAAILDAASPDGRLLGLDLDLDALKTAESNLQQYRDTATLVNESFGDLAEVARQNGYEPVDGILFDLGLSSLQLEGAGRGFSFRREEPLDMRFRHAPGVDGVGCGQRVFRPGARRRHLQVRRGAPARSHCNGHSLQPTHRHVPAAGAGGRTKAARRPFAGPIRPRAHSRLFAWRSTGNWTT